LSYKDLEFSKIPNTFKTFKTY